MPQSMAQGSFMSDIIQFPTKARIESNSKSVAVKDIDCLALLTNTDEQFVIDDPNDIVAVIAFMKQRGIKWRMEEYPYEQ